SSYEVFQLQAQKQNFLSELLD
ncbi:MAG: hypothetical protein RLZZ490_118, partial [Cyanobacteriota bacterium]